MFRAPVFAPLTLVESQSRAKAAAPALARRLSAFVYEGVLLFGLVMAVGMLFGVLMQQRHGLIHRQGLQAVLFLAMAVYFIGFWLKSGQTLAMKTWHLKLVRADGMPVRPMQTACRFVAAWVWFCPSLLINYWVQWHQTSEILGMICGWIAVYAGLSFLLPQRQFLHDLLCGTRLIDTRPAVTSAPA
jgi:uncharacterized RDD family membrane protein YckC